MFFPLIAAVALLSGNSHSSIYLTIILGAWGSWWVYQMRAYIARHPLPQRMKDGETTGLATKWAVAAALVLLAVSSLTIPNADAIADWSRRHLQGKDFCVAILAVLLIVLPPSLLLGILIGLCSRTVRKYVPDNWRPFI